MEQPGLRLTTRLIEISPEGVCIGLPVRVQFERGEDVWLPLFRKEEAIADAGLEPSDIDGVAT